jgi:ornithine cyclodeaminase
MSAPIPSPSVRVIPLEQILAVLPTLDLQPAIEAAFVAYSQGRATVPPVGELLFDSPPGDAHIKYGYVLGSASFVIKIATGFGDNPRQGLPSYSGVMLVFSARTGMLETVLLDGGHLTNVRTAIAGAIAARYLAPTQVDRIAVFGTGVQARLQLEAIAKVVDCRNVTVWGRRQDALDSYQRDMAAAGFSVKTARDAATAVRGAQVVVMTTPSTLPLLDIDHVAPGTLVIAMGSDTPEKQEITTALVGRADVYVVDSRSQSLTRGELHHAIAAGTRSIDSVVELGEVIENRSRGRSNDEQVVIADLTGVAVQDIAIASAVSRALS